MCIKKIIKKNHQTCFLNNRLYERRISFFFIQTFLLNLDRMLLYNVSLQSQFILILNMVLRKQSHCDGIASLVHEGRALNLKRVWARNKPKHPLQKQPALPGTQPSAEPSTTVLFCVHYGTIIFDHFQNIYQKSTKILGVQGSNRSQSGQEGSAARAGESLLQPQEDFMGCWRRCKV